ncbi:DMT family transporter [Halorussus caseinilyticus]|uniref:DMT family transporter n=1 Tax=Halorussus caseinilyticus TaxID=3034025 RepID=A0ABD5WM93_9EURY|nr:EamA family transporter [Halorussus sp. DT72]
MFALLAIFWGGSFVAIEVGLHYFPPLVFAGLRYAVAGAVILAYAALRTDRWRPRARGEYLAVGVVGALVIAGYHALLYLGERHVSGAIAAVVVSLSPVLTAGFAAVVLDERLTLTKGVGFALGIAGVAVVAGLNPASALSANVLGVGLVFLGGVCFALGAVLTRPLRHDLPAASLQAWAMLGGAVLLFGGGALRGESLSAIRLTPTALASFAYLTLLSGVVAFLLYFRLLEQIGPTKLHLVGYLEPVVATLVSWALLGELVSSSTLVGFAAIFAGFAVLHRGAIRSLADSVRESAFADSVRSSVGRGAPDAADSESGESAWSGSAGPADD